MGKPKNPYSLGPALPSTEEPEGLFVGRQDVHKLIEAELRAPDKNAVLLYGPHRSGKTALLLSLLRRLPSPPFLPFYFDLAGRAHSPISRVLSDLAATMTREVHMETPGETRFEGSITETLGIFQKEFLPAFFAALPGDYRPLLLLDDLDILDTVGERQLPPQSAARALPTLLGQLLSEEPRLGWVITSAHSVSELSTDLQEALRSARQKPLGLLDQESTRLVAQAAQSQGSLALKDGVLERIEALCSGHPYLLNVLCYHLFAAAWEIEGAAIPQVGVEEVDSAATRTMAAAEPYLEEMFSELGPAERVVLSAIAAEDASPVPVEAIAGALRRLGIRIQTRELELAPAALIERELLTKGQGGLSFSVELIRQFVRARKPPAKMRAIVQQIVPQASVLYQNALELREKWRFPEAQECLERALRQNPNHLGARILLGQILGDQGLLEQARRELEEAAQYDEEAARLPLLRTLLSQGEEAERQGEGEKALLCYERALSISPGEAVAQERRQAILGAQADRAYAAGNLMEARSLYERAGMPDRVSAIDDRSKSVQLRQHEQEALTCEAVSDWERALELYQGLAEREPTRFSDALTRARTEVLLRQRYAEGQEAITQGDWERALRALGEVARLRPSYRDSSELLSRAADAHAKRLRREASGQNEALPPKGRRTPLILAGIGIALVTALVVVWVARKPSGGPEGTGTPVDLGPSQTAEGSQQKRPGPKIPPLRVGERGVDKKRAERITLSAAASRLAEALDEARAGYRQEPTPGWFYDLGVLHDQLAECDDAAFFYRAAMFSKTVKAEDVAAVEGRLLALEDECHFKKRQATTADRRARATRYLQIKLCPLAESILSGIATSSEQAQIAQCLGKPLPQRPARTPPAQTSQKKAPVQGSGTGPALISVTARPWAYVFVDGVKIGQTPIRDKAISPGPHTVLLVNDALKKQHSYPINAAPGTTYTINYNWEPSK